ncbi:MAG TPA: hypothetical protein V6D14_27350 [Coleofasciculaceae cyanobacterium]
MNSQSQALSLLMQTISPGQVSQLNELSTHPSTAWIKALLKLEQ